jgi:hypothetical protein
MPEPKPITAIEVGLGFLLAIGLHIAVLGTLWFLVLPLSGWSSGWLATVWFVGLLGIGVAQLVYLVPAILMARRRGRPGIAKGIIIAASLTALLNATCWGLLWRGKFRIGG